MKLKNFLGENNPFSRPVPRHLRRPSGESVAAIESLEDRVLLSNYAVIPITEDHGGHVHQFDHLLVAGTNGSDAIVVDQAPGSDDLRLRIFERGRRTIYKVFSEADIRKVIIYDRGGNDLVYNTTDVPDEFHNGPGDDLLIGGNGTTTVSLFEDTDPIRFIPGAGDDFINGRGGIDILSGGEGNDLIIGGKGVSDTVSGGEGHDRLYGKLGADFIYGGAGNDYIEAGAGRDDGVDGGAGYDIILGGSGNDKIHGGPQNDRIYGGSGEDTLYGGRNSDLLWGEADNDALYGGEDYTSGVEQDSFDILNGGTGDDKLIGGKGDDRIEGGADKDTLLTYDDNFGQTSDRDYRLTDTTLTAFEADTSTIFAVDTFSGIEHVSLFGRDKDNVFDASAFTIGTVSLWGGGGNDTLRGGSGNDDLTGGEGADTLYGGDGDDDLDGGWFGLDQTNADGIDQLFGEAGDDDLDGDLGADIIDGGLGGNDTAVDPDGGAHTGPDTYTEIEAYIDHPFSPWPNND